MKPHEQIDVAAVLAAAYKRPDVEIDQVAARVRARLALLETLGESFRLLSEAPIFALRSTLNAGSLDEPSTPKRQDDA